MPGNKPIHLQLRRVNKAFGPVQALSDVDLELRGEEIHGLLGGNGAGKTTLMNVLYGLYKPDAGEIFLNDERIDIVSPRDAIRHGIGMVHQHFLQVNNFTVVENVVLGTKLKHRPTLDLKEEVARIRELSERFGLDVDPHTVIADLPMGFRQRVEILKALFRGVEILILDEPTTNLTPQEVDSLFGSLRTMVDAGMGVVFITHKLREVMAVCDTISILRDGRRVLTMPRSNATEDMLIERMVGTDLDVEQSIIFSQASLEQEIRQIGDQLVIEVSNLQIEPEENQPGIRDVSFEIHESEILGIAGIAGNGQKELVEGLLGIRHPASGTVLIDGVDVANVGTDKLLEQGVSYIPEDRLRDGYLPTVSVAQNLILGYQHQSPYSNRGFLNWRAIFQTSRDLIREYDIQTQGPQDISANLSGGNIQRVMIARALSRPVKFLVAHNPTHGLDIASTEFVYSRLLAGREKGMATLLLADDLDELLKLCDRIATIYQGRIVGILNRGEFDKYEIGRMMSGAKIDG